MGTKTLPHSIRKDFTGLANAVLMTSLLITAIATKRTNKAGIKNIHQLNGV